MRDRRPPDGPERLPRPYRPRFELRCADCGYGVVVRIAPRSCPMCHGSVWEQPRRQEQLAS
jgi:rubrerythrin